MSEPLLERLPTCFANVPESIINFGGISGYVTQSLSNHFTTPKSICTKLCVYFSGLIFTLPFLLFPIFTALKVDGELTWTWSQAFIPLWILDAFLFCIYIHFTRVDDSAVIASSTFLKNVMTKTQILSLVATVITQILVTMRLDGQLAWKWSYISLPYCFVMIFDPSIVTVLQVLQAIFVAQKLDFDLSWSWTVVLLPSWLPAFLFIFVLPSVVCYNMMNVSEDRSFPRAIAAFVGLLFTFLLIFGPQLLVLARLQYYVFSAIYIILPWLILYGLLVLGGLANVFAAPTPKKVENITVTVAYGAVFVLCRLQGYNTWAWNLVVSPLYAALVFDISWKSLFQVFQVILVAQKLDAVGDFSWLVILMPTWLPMILITFFVPIGMYLFIYSHEDDIPQWQGNVIGILGSFVLILLFFGPYFLLIIRLEFFTFAFVCICIPWLLLYVIFLLVFGCILYKINIHFLIVTMSSRALRTMQSFGRQRSLEELQHEAQENGGIPGFVTTTVSNSIKSSHGICFKLFIFLLLLTFTAPAILVPIFIAIKADGDVNWTWTETLIPLWILDAILFPVYIFLSAAEDQGGNTNEVHDTSALLAQENQDQQQPKKKLLTWKSVLSLICSIVTQVFIVRKLDGQLDWTWDYILLPLCAVILYDITFSSFLQVIQVIFIAAKLQKSVEWSWLVVLLPTWLPMALVMFLGPIGVCAGIVVSSRGGERSPWPLALAVMVGLFIILGFICSPHLLLVLRLQYFTFPSIYICLPWIVLYVLVAFFVRFSVELFLSSGPQMTVMQLLPTAMALLTFIAIKADEDVNWSWAVPKIPLWLIDAVLFLSFIYFTTINDKVNNVGEDNESTHHTNQEIQVAPIEEQSNELEKCIKFDLLDRNVRFDCLSLGWDYWLALVYSVNTITDHTNLDWFFNHIFTSHFTLSKFDSIVACKSRAYMGPNIFTTFIDSIAIKADGDVNFMWIVALTPLWILDSMLLPAFIYLAGIDLNKTNANKSEVFICLKVDGTVDWSWATTTIVLWIFDGLMFILIVLSSCDSSNKEEKNKFSILALISHLLGQIFVVLRLDHHISWSWSTIFIPFYVENVLNSSSSSFLQLLQIIFLALELDHTVTWKWEIVLIPTWIPLAFFIFLVPIGILVFNCISDDRMSALNLFGLIIGILTFFGLISAISVLIVIRQYYTFSTLYIALPWFILLGIIFIGGLIAVMFFDFSEEETKNRALAAICSALGTILFFGLICAPSVLVVLRQYYTFSTLYIALSLFIIVGIVFIVVHNHFLFNHDDDKGGNYQAAEA
ncbi:hypothetical protein THRCLA_04674 [Thraustotheca clavata]|uniref:Uncharacterized protein n=1 Tax=Thraustotheca clavata TaxID=74557 RepID=A0A1V9ZY98_9STRA|nr:hypothetical protein THRCLA_04674 [Thraustotheca clavata]